MIEETAVSEESTAEYLPLAGITVLDFTHGVAGPYTTMLFADLGATVWKIEKPGRGDATRYMNVSKRFRIDIPRSGGDYFLAINRNKYSIGVDLQTDGGRVLMLELAKKADIAVSNFRPGVMERLGLGYQQLNAANPKLIYASLSAYGSSGPMAGQPGMDVAIQARSGVMSITGYGDGRPVKPGASLADFGGGVHLATAVLAALFRRERTGKGQEISVSLLDATLHMLINYSVAVMDGQAEIAPMGSGHPQLVPFQAFPTSGGFIVIATGTNRLFTQLCEVLNVPELAKDERFISNSDRVVYREELIPLLSAITAGKTTQEWIEIFEREGIPCAPVNTLTEAFADEQLQSNGMVVLVEHSVYGDLHLLGSPYEFNGERSRTMRPPPLLGEDTEEILRGALRLDDEAINRLQRERVI